MMNFFRNLFKKKEEVVRLEELDKWFEAKTKPERGEIKVEIYKIQKLKEQLQESLKVLEKAEIKQETQQKVKDVVMGNVPAYIRAVEIFIEKIDLPEEVNTQNLKNLYQTIQTELDQLGKKTARNFAIIQTLIGKELAATAKTIKEIDETSKAIHKRIKKLERIEWVKEQIEQTRKTKKNKAEYQKLRENYEAEKEKLGKEIGQAEKNIKELDEGEEAKELKWVSQATEEIEKNKKELDNELLNLFSPLIKAFKRYNNLYYIRKVEDYINNPVETLKNDREMDIIKYLGEVKNMVRDNKIDLKEEKKEKIQESLEKLNEEYLKKFLQEHDSLDEEKNKLDEKKKQNRYVEKREDLQRKIEEKQKKREEVEEELGKIKEINIKESIQEIEKEIKKLGYGVSVHAMD